MQQEIESTEPLEASAVEYPPESVGEEGTEQKALSFDRETVKNIAKGAFHATMVSALLGLLDYAAIQAGLIHSNNVLVSVGIAWFTQNGYQVIRQFIKGL
ncbi:MAG: hypothetical protein WA082_04505 [Candidatus Moraniibacteriota bacterium]